MFVGVVTFLSVQGVPVPVTFLGFYLVAVGCMLGMQRRARESCESMERQRRRHRESSTCETRVTDTDTDTETDAPYASGTVPQGTFRA